MTMTVGDQYTHLAFTFTLTMSVTDMLCSNQQKTEMQIKHPTHTQNVHVHTTRYKADTNIHSTRLPP